MKYFRADGVEEHAYHTYPSIPHSTKGIYACENMSSVIQAERTCIFGRWNGCLKAESEYDYIMDSPLLTSRIAEFESDYEFGNPNYPFMS